MDFTRAKVGFKIFGLYQGQLTSLTVNREGRRFYTEEWTYPEEGWGPFAVLKTREDVVRFKRRNGWMHNPVFVVRYMPSEERHLYNSEGCSLSVVPDGTDFADAIFIEELILA